MPGFAVEMSEFLLSSPELPIISLDDNLNPIYGQELDSRVDIYPNVMTGMFRYCDKFFENFDEDFSLSSFDDWVEYIRNWALAYNPQDIENFSKILKSEKSDNKTNLIKLSKKIFSYL